MPYNFESYVIVGKLHEKITQLLDSKLPNSIIYMAPGLRKHIKKRHIHCLKYIDQVPEIIDNPDYVGINPNEPDSVELVKVLGDNILVSVNLSKATETEYLYVSSLYDISDSKLNNRLNSGRFRRYV